MKKRVVITGASRGIGFATAKLLAEGGYHVIGVARSKPKEKFPGDFISCDLSDESKVQELLSSIEAPVDALVNNVGILQKATLDEIEMDSLHALYDVNVRTAVQMTQGLVAGMKKKGWGRIVNLSSRAIFGVSGMTAYAASKAALVSCTRVWALELADYGITVNAVAPGPIETDMLRSIRPAGSPQDKARLANLPLGRVGDPKEVAATIAFFLSEDAGYITGQTLCVDGGASL